MYWDIGESVDYSVQTLWQESKRYKDGVPEELNIFVTNPTKREGKPFWTIHEWLKFREENEAVIDRDTPEGARPPTPEELDQLRRDREARIAAKWAEVADDDSID